MSGQPSRTPATGQRTGLARALSKLGYCSRSAGWKLVLEGKVQVNGVTRTDPEWRIHLGADQIEVEGTGVEAATKAYLMLNKPRGLVTTVADEQGRATVFESLKGAGLPFVAPVGRLDKASEGLLLLTNDTNWAARITDPATHLDKTYHVQVHGIITPTQLARMRAGVVEGGDVLRVKRARVLRAGEKNTWLELLLDEGKNRHIRRLLAVLRIEVLRLIRVAIGPLPLGELPKGQWRALSPVEMRELNRAMTCQT